ncbi:mucin-2-like [Narcine bancroftii]|uniref:mucin-2-like n=1 Tax=Narcine bancroftii TaxID=1343680 RepID=UPI0038316827
MKHTGLVVIWILILFEGYDSSDYILSNYKEDVLTQYFSTSNGNFSKSNENYVTCKTWGSGSVKTFNNEAFYFKSNCELIMSRLCKSDLDWYEVTIRRGLTGYLEEILIQIDVTPIFVKNGVIKVKDENISLPYDDKLIKIHNYGANIIFSNKKHHISLIWNRKDALTLKLHPEYRGNVCGLCGDFDQEENKVLKLKDVNLLFVNEKSIDSSNCYSTIPKSIGCASALNCQKTISRHFFSCDKSEIYFNLCILEVCTFPNNQNSHCPSLTELAHQCPSINYDWRKTSQCEIPKCPGNQIYNEFGPSLIPSCTDPDPLYKDVCESACECPEGTVLDNIRRNNICIQKSECPCEYSGNIYDSGERRNTSCETCVCKSGLWKCSHLSCCQRCKVEEGTHITTFDGKWYNLRGDCIYKAVVGDFWTVEIELNLCHITTEQICLRRVIFSENESTYEFNNNGDILLDGENVALPLKRGETIIFKQCSHFIQFKTTHGLAMQIQILPIMQLYISLLEDENLNLKGLCGNFNGMASDDFMSVQNMVEPSHIMFAHSWATDSSCKPPEKENPTCISSEKEYYAKEHCSVLKDSTSVFAKCHSTVDYIQYYQICKNSLCHCRNLDNCVCAALGAYVHACAEKGVLLSGWAGKICNTTCENNQVFENDMRMCNRTCKSLSKFDFTCDVKDTPVYGCGCPEGKYMNENGRCVDQKDCSCFHNGMYLFPGEKNGDCTCLNGLIICNPTIETTTTPTDCKGGKEYVHCSPGSKAHCRKKCSNLELSCPDKCESGCACPEGQAEDDKGNCVLSENCPCSFEGNSYAKGKVIQNDCNKCTCLGGFWNCMKNPCPKTCKVYGEGHYITFDDKQFAYEGNCEYIFVQDYCNEKPGTFQVLIESIPCCENGVTCSRNVKIIFQGEELILEDGKVKVSKTNFVSRCKNESYSIHTVGLYLILTFSDGITVIWDKHTRLSVTLQEHWMNKVCGLCGDFNSNTEDDFTTKFQMLAINSIDFGNSWKSRDSCLSSPNQKFPCEENPFCSPWAEKKCSIINNVNGEFQPCHNKVDPGPYYDACLKEACACDKEGKYLGFCTAVAVYAEACNKAGVCIRWRTPERCPVYCDYYNDNNACSWHYQPCGTLTAKTCSDHTIGKKFSAVLEGCYPKCPESAPYLDENIMKCVKLDQCTCYFNGQIYNAFQEINGCEYCKCIEGNVTCEVTTPATSPTTLPTTTSTTLSTTSTPTPSTSPTTESTTSTPIPTTLSTTSTPTPSTSPTTESTTSTPIPTTLSTTSTPTPSTSPTTESTTSTPIPTTLSTTSTPTPSTSPTTESTTSTPIPTTLSTTSTPTSSTSPTTESTTSTPIPTTLSTTSTPTPSTSPTTTLSTTSTPTPSTSPTTESTTSTPIPTTLSTTSTPTPSTSPTTESTTSTPIPTTLSTTSTPTSSTSPTTESTTSTPIPTTLSTTSTPTPSTSPTTTLSTTSTPTPSTSPTTESTTSTPIPTTLSTTSTPTPSTSPTTESTTSAPIPTTLSTTSTPTPSTSPTTESTTSTPIPTTLSTTSTPTPSTSPTTTLSTTSTPTPSTSPTTESTTSTPIPTTLSTTSTPTPSTSPTTESTTSTPIPTTLSTTSTPTSSTSPTTESTTSTPIPTTLSTTSTPTPSTSPTTTLSTTSTPTPSTSPTTESTTSTPIPTTLSTTSTPTPSTSPTTESTTSTPIPTTLSTTSTPTPSTSPTTESTTSTPIPTTLSTTSTPTPSTSPTTTLSTTSTPTPSTSPTTESTTSTPIPTTLSTTSTPTPSTSPTTESTTSTPIPTTLSTTSTPTPSTSPTTTLSTSTPIPTTLSTTSTSPITESTTSTSATTSTMQTSPSTTISNCAGKWSIWRNRNEPNITNRGDHETPEGLCHYNLSPDNIQCQAIKFPKTPVLNTSNNVICSLPGGLKCTVSTTEFMCPDYRIRVCCVFSTTTPRTTILTTTPVPTTSTTILTSSTMIPTTSTTVSTTPTTTIPTTSTTVSTTPTTTIPTTSTTVSTTPTTTIPTTSTTVTTTPTTTIPTSSTTVTTIPTSTIPTTSTTVTTTPTTTIPTTSTTVSTTPTITIPTTSTTVLTTPTTTIPTTRTTVSTTLTTTIPTTSTTVSTTLTTTIQTTSTTVSTTPTITIPTTSTTVTTPTTTIPTTSTTVTTTPTTTIPTTSTTVSTTPTTTIPTTSTTVSTTPTTTIPTSSTTVTTTPTTTIPTSSTIVTTTPTTTIPTTSTTVTTTPTTTIPTTSTTVTTTPTTTIPTTSTTVTTPTTTIPTTSTTVTTTPTTTIPTTSTTVTTTPTTTIPTTSTTVTTPTTTIPTTSTTVTTTPTTTIPTTSTTVTTPTTTIPTSSTTVSTTPTTTIPTTRTTVTTPTTTIPTTSTTVTTPTTTIPTTSTTVTTPTTTIPTTSTTVLTTPTTTIPTTSTIVSTTPSIFCPCNVNKEKLCSGTWTEDCSIRRCENGQIIIEKTCEPKMPTCSNNLKPIEVINECGCPDWECGCECEVYGDPHYITFNGLPYDFYKNCTYVLMEERIPKHNFRVLVDNFFCFSFAPYSCPKGLIIFYKNTHITISTYKTHKLKVDGIRKTIPYITDGIRITELPSGSINTYFNDIKTTIIAELYNFKISVAEEFFFNNTQGQCGTCTNVSNDDCIRPSGTIENTDCCPTTALDWTYNDPNKPYCTASAPSVPCSPEPTPTPCTPHNDWCEIIFEKLFEHCSKDQLNHYYNSCKLDNCVSNSSELVCTSIKSAAEYCNKQTCVDWRSIADECKMECKENFVYKACVQQYDDYCENNSVIRGSKQVSYHEGCFCPDGMIISEDKTKCVPTCCIDNHGKRRKIGDEWQDQNNTCISHTCTSKGVITHRKTCGFQPPCKESDKEWDEDHCCYTCNKEVFCKKRSVPTRISVEVHYIVCSATIELNVCEGNCPSSAHFNTTTHRIERECACCQETMTEDRSVMLECPDGVTRKEYTYTYIKSCNCNNSVCLETATEKPHYPLH